jgi:hypothetical protein
MATDLDASHRVCPPLTLNRCYPRTSSQLDHPSVPRNGREQREQEAWQGKTFSISRMARCAAGKGLPSIRRNDAPNTMGRSVCSMLPASPTVAPVPLRMQCQGHGASTKKPRRVSAVLHPLPRPTPAEALLSSLSVPPAHPILWGDWSRSQPRRAWVQWLRRHLVTVKASPGSPPIATPVPLSRAQRAHWRLTWQHRLARNARPPSAPPIEMTIYGLSPAFAQSLGLRSA